MVTYMDADLSCLDNPGWGPDKLLCCPPVGGIKLVEKRAARGTSLE